MRFILNEITGFISKIKIIFRDLSQITEFVTQYYYNKLVSYTNFSSQPEQIMIGLLS